MEQSAKSASENHAQSTVGLTTPQEKVAAHTARLNPQPTPVDVFSELLQFARVEAASGQCPGCFCQEVLEPDTKCLYCRSTIAINQLWKERNSHYQLLEAMKALVAGFSPLLRKALNEDMTERIEAAEQAISAAEEGL